MAAEHIHILCLSSSRTYFDHFGAVLGKHAEITVSQGFSAEHGLQAARLGTADALVVAEELEDMSGLQLVKTLVGVNPIINCALVSPLYPQEFHEQTEGLGVLMQLPELPGAAVAEQLLTRLGQLYRVRF